MNEHEKHTEFLRQCVLYDESARRQNLVKEIAWIQRDLRCVRRAMWLMAFLAALVVAVLGYGRFWCGISPTTNRNSPSTLSSRWAWDS